ncbi:MAG: SUMF1/EgtB/PvdO family nonheme iron enzyme [Terriglobales bacterium]
MRRKVAKLATQLTREAEDFYPEERPVHEVSVDGLWIDCYEVTNEQFAHFVEATSYKTLAERPLNPDDFPGTPAENLVPGSMLFHKTEGPVSIFRRVTQLTGPRSRRYGTTARNSATNNAWPG